MRSYAFALLLAIGRISTSFGQVLDVNGDGVVGPDELIGLASGWMGDTISLEHDHLGETWFGSQPLSVYGVFDSAPLILSNRSPFGDTLRLDSIADGLFIDSTGINKGEGEAGGVGVSIVAGTDGLQVISAGRYGLTVGQAERYGVLVYSAESHGMVVNQARENGLVVDFADLSGLVVGNANHDGARVDSAGMDGFRVVNASGSGFVVADAGQYGLRVDRAELDGVMIKVAQSDGVRINRSENHGLSINEAINDGVHVSSAGAHGLIVNHAGLNGLVIDHADRNGIVIGQSEWDGIRVDRSGLDAISGHSTGANQFGGRFTNASSEGSGVYTRAGSDGKADLLLGGNSSQEDDGIIEAVDFPSSDVVLSSNDDIKMRIDKNQDENGELVVVNGLNLPVVRIDEQGNLSISGTLTQGTGLKISAGLFASGIVRGNIVLDNRGEAWVDVPPDFEPSPTTTYHLTCVGGYAPVFVGKKVQGGRFLISGGMEGIEVSWAILP